MGSSAAGKNANRARAKRTRTEARTAQSKVRLAPDGQTGRTQARVTRHLRRRPLRSRPAGLQLEPCLQPQLPTLTQLTMMDTAF
jgi:hypothetical protein